MTLASYVSPVVYSRLSLLSMNSCDSPLLQCGVGSSLLPAASLLPDNSPRAVWHTGSSRWRCPRRKLLLPT